MQLTILGRQPELSLAELEAVFGREAIVGFDHHTALINQPQIDINRFGGLLKVGSVLEADITDKNELLQVCLEHLPQSNSKVTAGLSWYGTRLSTREAFAFGLELKKLAKRRGLRLRIIPNKQLALSAAQVHHNDLLEEGNVEFLVTGSGAQFSLAKTTGVQDIAAYGKRDHGRPSRDAKVGMLPPKLAQIMLNLAAVTPDQTVLDPFCGTGVVLQETLLLGAQACGSDLEPRMIDMTRNNLEWLGHEYDIDTSDIPLQSGDARKLDWSCPFDAVVSELYLGPPLSSEPSHDKLTSITAEIDNLLVGSLKNIAQAAKSGTRLCLAIPAWQTKRGAQRLPSVDSLGEIGYNRVSFESASNRPLIYAREGQIVARELLTLTRK